MSPTTSLEHPSYIPPQSSVWSGFYRKALKERQHQLKLLFPKLFSPSPKQNALCSPTLKADDETSIFVSEKKEEEPFPIRGLDARVADNMVENCIGTVGLPVGLALNFVINGVPLVIPMAIEEPSVIAAVSGAAKTICASAVGGKGFQAVAPLRNVIIAQVALLDLDANAIENAKRTLEINYGMIVDAANQYIPNMVSRGGGVIDFEVRIVPKLSNPNPRHRADLLSSGMPPHNEKWLVCHFHIDVCDAMGANCASTVAEGTAPLLASLTGGRIGLRIVSNLCVQRLAKASFRVPVPSLAYKSLSGLKIATRLLEAYEWAESDLFRAATHNKGVMNGVDAVALATGQDWRAIAAASHAWASYNAIPGSSTPYRSLTRYWIEKENEDDDMWDEESARSTGKGLVLCGELQLPLSVGTKGGVLNTNPTYAYTLGIMGCPNAKTLAMAMVSVGLAQNFGALRALVSEGIQRGHMSLHARNIAVAAGCPSHAINEVTAYMVSSGRINVTSATEYLRAHEHLATLRKHLRLMISEVELMLAQERIMSASAQEDLVNHSSELLSIKNSAAEENHAHRRAHASRDAYIKSLTSKLSAFETTITELKEERVKLEGWLKKAADAREVEIEHRTAESGKSYQTQIAELNARLEEGTCVLNSSEGKITGLERQLDVLKRELSVVKTRAAKAEGHVDEKNVGKVVVDGRFRKVERRLGHVEGECSLTLAGYEEKLRAAEEEAERALAKNVDLMVRLAVCE